MANYNSSYTGAQVDAAIGTVQAGVAHSPVLGLSTNSSGDPIINLSYEQGGTAQNSPVQLSQDNFVIQSNHVKTKLQWSFDSTTGVLAFTSVS